MKRMIDNKKMREIEASGGTQWYCHNLYKKSGSSIYFVLPFEKNLLELNDLYSPKNVFGVVLDINGPSVGDINVNSTFPILTIFSTYMYCYTLKSDGSLAITRVNFSEYIGDNVTKYQVF